MAQSEEARIKKSVLIFQPLPNNAKHLDLEALHWLVKYTKRPILFFDIESTTYVNDATFGITEIALIAVNLEKKISCASTLLDVKQPIHPEVVKKTGISQASLIGQPEFPEIADLLRKLFIKATVSGYFSRTFDLPGIAKECERFKIETISAPYGLDLQELVEPMGFRGKKKLTELSTSLGITLEGNAHRAMYDTLLTTAVAAKITEKLGPHAFDDSKTTAFLGK